MAHERILQINSYIKTEVSFLLESFVQDNKTGLLTVTRVDTAPDMKASKVWVSVFEARMPSEVVLKKIVKKSHLIQSELWKKMAVRKVPRLQFKLDENPEYVERIDEILEEIKLNS